MPANYVLLGEVTLGANAASVTLANIPQTGYTDLKVVTSVRMSDPTYGYDNIKVSFNGAPSGTAYSGKLLQGHGGGVISQSSSSADGFTFINSNGSINTANTFSNGELYITNYTSSNSKSISADSVTEGNTTANYYTSANFGAGLFASASAIQSIVFTPFTALFVTG